MLLLPDACAMRCLGGKAGIENLGRKGGVWEVSVISCRYWPLGEWQEIGGLFLGSVFVPILGILRNVAMLTSTDSDIPYGLLRDFGTAWTSVPPLSDA